MLGILGVALLFIGTIAFSALLIWAIINMIRKKRYKPQMIGAVTSIIMSIIGVIILYNVGKDTVEAERIESSERAGQALESQSIAQSIRESESIQESEDAAEQSRLDSEAESTSIENLTEEEKVIKAINDNKPAIEITEVNGQFDIEPYTMAITINGRDNLTTNMIRKSFMMDIHDVLVAMNSIDYKKLDNIAINVMYDNDFMIKSNFDSNAIESVSRGDSTYKDLENLSTDWWVSPRIKE